jgi:uncharacterized protein YjbI with pentapeptide repeats
MPISGTELTDFTMQHCNFAYGTLAENFLAECTITDSRLIEANLDHCNLRGANLAGSDLQNISATGLTIENADLRGSRFNNLHPRDISLVGVKLHYSQLLAVVEPLGLVLQPDPD